MFKDKFRAIISKIRINRPPSGHLYKVGEFIEEYKKALKIDPKYVKPHISLGVLFKNKGSLDNAIEEWKTALGLDPKCIEAYGNLGNAFYKKELYDEAVKAYEDFIRYAPPEYAKHAENFKEVIRLIKGEKCGEIL